MGLVSMVWIGTAMYKPCTRLHSVEPWKDCVYQTLPFLVCVGLCPAHMYEAVDVYVPASL